MYSSDHSHLHFIVVVIDGTYTTLSTSYECKNDNPNLAVFKYDKNKPQRLSFVANSVDMKTGGREEYCVRNYFASTIQVEPNCDEHPYADEMIYEAYFHEFI